MPRLPQLRAKQVERALMRAGFELDTKRGSHRTYYNPETDKHTTVAFHPGILPKGTLRAIINQTGMSVDEFVGCLKRRKK
jgi:predicted RNA binding protein YcfA (HicA-like mRNA interferase family)